MSKANGDITRDASLQALEERIRQQQDRIAKGAAKPAKDLRCPCGSGFVKGQCRRCDLIKRPEPLAETHTAAELLAMELPEPRFAVPGLIPEGLSYLAGKPKLGKSWLVLLIGLAAACGGVALGRIAVEAGPVLYLALEDSRRRLKDRIKKLLAVTGMKVPDAFEWAVDWKRQDKGGIADLMDWLEAHPGARLIIVDTWPKFRPGKIRGRDISEEDYEHLGQLKALADKYHVAILIVMHCRKMAADDRMALPS